MIRIPYPYLLLMDPDPVPQLCFYVLIMFNRVWQERTTQAEKNERLQSQLRSLKEDLANTRDDQVSAILCLHT